MRVSNSKLVDPGQFPPVDNMTAGFTSRAQSVEHILGYAVQAHWPGNTPVGTFKIQVSCDKLNWVDDPLSVRAVSGSPGGFLVNSSMIFYNWIRAVYTPTSGGGFMTVTFNEKGV